MSQCYECGDSHHDLSPRSRCVNCEHRCYVETDKENLALRSLLTASLERERILREALEKIRGIYGDGYEVDNVASEALTTAKAVRG